MRKTLTAFVPAHKQTNPEHVPGQQVNPLGFTVNSVKQECCGNPLRGCNECPPKKRTFEEWLRQSSFVEPDAGTKIWLQDCWQAAQENCR